MCVGGEGAVPLVTDVFFLLFFGWVTALRREAWDAGGVAAFVEGPADEVGKGAVEVVRRGGEWVGGEGAG